jgi:phenylalanyl-tRNA synthetase beta chain
MITYSFVSEKEYDLFNIDKTSDEHKFIKIINPIGEDLAVMRTSLIPSAVRVACNNINRKNNEGRLFELAKVYNPKSLPLQELPNEKLMLSLVSFGENEDFFTIKGVVESILSNFVYDAEIKYLPSKVKCMHPTRSADVYVDGQLIGAFGQVHPLVIAELDTDKAIFCAEINYDKLKNSFRDKIVVKAISKFPIVERDIALVIDDSVPYADIIKVIKENGGEYLDKVTLFDIYKGAQVGEGKKSMAFNLIFVANDRTLNVDEIDDTIKNVLNKLGQELSAELR